MSRMKKGEKYSSFPLGIYVLLLVMIIVFVQIMLKRNASSATAELLFHF